MVNRLTILSTDSMTYACPTVLPNVPNMKCEIKFGQIQKVAFQRQGQSFTREEITTKAGWSAFLTSQTASKIVVTPFVEAPTSDGGDERTFGSGNQVLDGIEIIMGINPVKMTFALRHYPQIIIEALKHLAQFRDLGVFFFTGDGRIIALKENNLYKAIPIRSLFVGDLLFGGLTQPDRNQMSFYFKANYSDHLALIQPEFNPMELMNINDVIGDGSFSRAFNFSFDV